jgi:GGDEF domain-containing protein
LAAAFASIALDPPSATTGAIVVLFFALALVADLRPVPMDDNGKSEVSIASVFIVTSAILFGWRFAAPLAALSIGITYAVARRPLIRIGFNASMYAISAWAAALPVLIFGQVQGGQPGKLTAYVLLGGAIHLVANVMLVSGAISISNGAPYRKVVLPGLRHGGGAFAIKVLLAALAANLWVMHSWLLVLLAGPLFTLTLYQRSALHSRIATRDARTDNLTGLGNHRAYQAVLRERIAECERGGDPFSLCLVDVDNFKHVNDVYGHPVGDDVLVLIAELLGVPENAEAFRFGGDEFSVLFSLDEMRAYREVEAIQRRPCAERAIAGRAGDDQRRDRVVPHPCRQRRGTAADRGRCPLLVEAARQEPFLPLQPFGRPHLLARRARAGDRAQRAPARGEEPRALR